MIIASFVRGVITDFTASAIDRVVVLESPIESPHLHAEAFRDAQERLVGGPLDDHFIAAPHVLEHDGRREPVGEAGAA